MSKEFKPGDLALVINAAVPDNLGKVVCLIRKDSSAMVSIKESGAYLMNSERQGLWVVSGEMVGRSALTGKLRQRSHAAFLPEQLMPLKGDEQPAQVRQAERVQ